MKRNGNYSVKLKTIVEAHDLHPLHLSKDYESALLTTADITARPCSSPASIITSTRSAADHGARREHIS